jgi:GT2 family glycosyltransferase
MKTIFSVTYHQSKKLRPNGEEFLKNYIRTLRGSIDSDFGIVIVDNQSEINLSKWCEDHRPEVLDYIRIEDQSIGGLTGAWNAGIRRASELGDIIINTNEDLVFNNSINDFVSEIQSDNENSRTIYGPLSNGVGELAHPHQFSNCAKDESNLLLRSSNMLKERPGKGGWSEVLNGFFLGFTREFYHTFKSSDDLFPIDHKHNRGDGKWGGQEGLMLEWAESGCMCKVIPRCWIDHAKIRSYRVARNHYGDGGL